MNTRLLFIYNIIRCFLPDTHFYRFKRKYLQLVGVKMGGNTRVTSSVKITGNGKLEIGANTWIGLNTLIITSGTSLIKIGDNVDIAPQVYIGTGSHEVNNLGTRRAGKGINKNITIGKGTWVGARAVILPGVNIGEMCVIAAGSVVTQDVPSNTMVAGVPARVIKNFKEDVE